MKRLLLLLLLCTLSGQNVFTDFFKHSTAYSSFFVTSPMRENDRFQLVTDNHGNDFWNSSNMHMERIDRGSTCARRIFSKRTDTRRRTNQHGLPRKFLF